MDSEFALAFLKIASVIIGALLGIAGLLADFRTSAGKLSRAGIAVLSGMILSAIVGVCTTSIESYKARSSSAEQATRTEVLLRQLNRTILPIRNLFIASWFEIPPLNDGVVRYIERLERELPGRLMRMERFKPAVQGTEGLYAWDVDDDGAPIDVTITAKSDLWPTEEEIRLLANANYFPMYVAGFKEPMDPRAHLPLRDKSDFSAIAPDVEDIALVWNLKKKQLVVMAKNEFKTELWHTSGKITSLHDLRGSQLLLFPPGIWIWRWFGQPSDSWNADMTVVPYSLRLQKTLVTLGNGHRLWLRETSFTRDRAANGSVVFSVVFPTNDRDFENLTTEVE